MANEVCKYNNDFNTVSMRNWTTEEMNFLMVVLAKLKNQGNKTIRIQKNELVELANYSERNNKKLYNIMDKLSDHVTNLKFTDRTKGIKKMVLFQTFEWTWDEDPNNYYVEVKVNDDFEYILNYFELNFNFTSFGLEEFVNLKSSYSKQMYRLLKQWKKQGNKEFKIEEFRELLAIPKSYSKDAINQRVLKPIQKELGKCFDNFKIKPIKKRTKGNPIIAYQFSWTPEKTNEWIEGQPQPNPNKPKKPKQVKSVELDEKFYPQAEEKSTEEIQQEMLELQRKLKEGSL